MKQPRTKYVCYCGSEGCPQAQCRFYQDQEQAKREQAEFWKQWAEMERREQAA